MRKGHKKNFMFTNKSQSERGIMSTVLGILSDVSIGLAVFSSFRIGGRASARLGTGILLNGIGVCATGFILYAGVFGL